MNIVRVRLTVLLLIGLVNSGWTAQQAASQREKLSPDTVSRIELDHVRLRDAIRNLARQVELNYILDSTLTGRWRSKEGKPQDEPELTVQWRNLTLPEALKKVLHDYHLEMVENPQTSVARIIPAGKRNERKTPLPAVPEAGEKIPVVVLDEVAVLDAVTRFASQAHLIPTLDPNISATCFEMVLERPVSVHWENITAYQALAALFDSYGLIMECGSYVISDRHCLQLVMIADD